MTTRKEAILDVLSRRLGEGHEELAGSIEAIVELHPHFRTDSTTRGELRRAVQNLMRPRTNNLRALIHAPDEIVAALARGGASRMDMLEI